MHQTCPSCGQPIVMDQNTAGRVVACPKCGEAYQVPGDSSPSRPLSLWAIGGLTILLAFVLYGM